MCMSYAHLASAIYCASYIHLTLLEWFSTTITLLEWFITTITVLEGFQPDEYRKRIRL